MAEVLEPYCCELGDDAGDSKGGHNESDGVLVDRPEEGNGSGDDKTCKSTTVPARAKLLTVYIDEAHATDEW